MTKKTKKPKNTTFGKSGVDGNCISMIKGVYTKYLYLTSCLV